MKKIILIMGLLVLAACQTTGSSKPTTIDLPGAYEFCKDNPTSEECISER